MKKISRSRVLFDLYSVYKGKEEKIEVRKERFENDGVAEVEVKLYYPPGHEGSDTAEYYFIATHTTAKKPVKSATITVPQCPAIEVHFVKIADVHFRHYCALPCLDEKGELLSSLESVYAFVRENGTQQHNKDQLHN